MKFSPAAPPSHFSWWDRLRNLSPFNHSQVRSENTWPPPHYGPSTGKIMVGGLDGAGKSTVLNKCFGGDRIETFIPTIGLNIEHVQHREAIFVSLDFGGGGFYRFMKLISYMFAEGCGAVWVVDSTDRDRLVEVREELYRARNDLFQDMPILVLATKQDLPGAVSAAEITRVLHLHEMKGLWKLQSGNAVTGEGLVEGMLWLSNAILSRQFVEMTEKRLNKERDG